MKNISNQVFYVGKWRVEASINQISSGEETLVLPPKVMSTLVLLAETSGQPITHQKLLARLWPEQVVSDSSLYQAIATLRKSLGDTGGKRKYIEKISGKGYRLIAEVSFHRIPIESERPKKWRLLSPVLVIIVLSIIVMVISKSQYNSKNAVISKTENIPANRIQTVKILPFKNQNINIESSLLVGGLEDALLTQLVSVKGLQVIKAQYPEAEDIFGFADHSSDAILSGRIQFEKDQLRVNLQLQSTQHKTIIWAREFSGKSSRLFTLQDEITQALLALFQKPQTTQSFSPEFITPELFNDYLIGRFKWAQRKTKSLQQAEIIFVSLIKQSPEFALVYVGLCDTYLYNFIYRDWLFENVLDRCNPLLEKALKIQPNLGEAMATKAFIMSEQGELEQSILLFRKALENAPNYAIGHMWFGNLLRNLGYLKEAEKEQRQAFRLAPQSPIINRNLAFVLLNQAKVIPARHVYSNALRLEPEYTNRALDELDFFALNVQRAAAFINWIKKNPEALKQNPNLLISQSLVSLAIGNVQQSRFFIEQASQKKVAQPWLLFAKAVIAEFDGNMPLMKEILMKRERLHINQQKYILTVINMLYSTGKVSEALKMAELNFPNLTSSTLEVKDANIYQLMNYSYMLKANGQTKKATRVALTINTYLLDHLNLENVFHLEWIASQGKQKLASNYAKNLLDAGWLPNYYGELFSLHQMKNLYSQGDLRKQSEFEKILENNQKKARDLIDSKYSPY